MFLNETAHSYKIKHHDEPKSSHTLLYTPYKTEVTKPNLTTRDCEVVVGGTVFFSQLFADIAVLATLAKDYMSAVNGLYRDIITVIFF